MPTSKLNLGQNPPQNGVSNGSVVPSRSPTGVSKNGDHHSQYADKTKLSKTSDTPQRYPQSVLDKFAQENFDDSGIASGSSILSASSSETLDTKVTDPGALNGDSVNSGYLTTARPSDVSNGACNNTTSSRSPDFRVRFDTDSSDSSNIPATTSDICYKNESEDSLMEGATGVNPTLWLGDDQMLLLPGNSRSEETDSTNSGTSETKSFEGLLSPNGTSILWDEDTDWILLFDNMIRYADRKQHRTTRSCGCKGK